MHQLLHACMCSWKRFAGGKVCVFSTRRQYAFVTAHALPLAQGKEHKLWLMHWLVEEQSDLERAIVRNGLGNGAQMSSARHIACARLGGMAHSKGGRRADA